MNDLMQMRAGMLRQLKELQAKKPSPSQFDELDVIQPSSSNLTLLYTHAGKLRSVQLHLLYAHEKS
jgi:hypothetical protein